MVNELDREDWVDRQEQEAILAEADAVELSRQREQDVVANAFIGCEAHRFWVQQHRKAGEDEVLEEMAQEELLDAQEREESLADKLGEHEQKRQIEEVYV